MNIKHNGPFPAPLPIYILIFVQRFSKKHPSNSIHTQVLVSHIFLLLTMKCSDTILTSSSISPSHPRQTLVMSPCAACKILRRRCVEKCVLAPYFPPNDPVKFTTAHRVFGASNIIKFLQVMLISYIAFCSLYQSFYTAFLFVTTYMPVILLFHLLNVWMRQARLLVNLVLICRHF